MVVGHSNTRTGVVINYRVNKGSDGFLGALRNVERRHRLLAIKMPELEKPVELENFLQKFPATPSRTPDGKRNRKNQCSKNRIENRK
ncbi:MAG: hypothetical protein ACFFD4_38420 [Candidatus Odinarchaeota archaeon]